MDVANNPNAAAAAAASAAAVTPASADESQADVDASIFGDDIDTFLRLLTTQLQNQDPLDPVDTTQFTEQIANYSGVEQQIRTNQKLDQLIANASPAGEDLDQLAGWIGKSVQIDGAGASFTGDPVRFAAPSLSDYDRATAQVRNEAGELIREFDLSADAATQEWDGLDSDGFAAPNGAYKIDVAYYRGEEAVKTTPAELYQSVDEVRLTDDGWRLKLGDGRYVAIDEVTAVR